MSQLFSPISFRGLEIKNRAWVAPMCQYSSDDGVVGDWHLVHLGAFATGGAGLVIAEATAVVPEGRISTRCPGLWNEEQVAAWRRVTDFVHGQGAHIGVQLAHAGRKASTNRPWDSSLMAESNGWVARAPSAIAFEGYPVPSALSLEEIDEVVEAFGAAAARAVHAGFDVLEIHAAHGYLLHEFLSPISNHRDDQYGGSFANRVRLLIDIVDKVREMVPTPLPLFVRISATDYVDGGWDLEQSVALAKLLKDHGVDLVDTSSGGNVPKVPIPTGPGYQVAFASAIRSEAGIPTGAVGEILDGPQAESILRAGNADAILVARAFLRNPHWANQAAENLGEAITWPMQYDRARRVRPAS